MRAFWHQYFRYARGDGKAGLFAKRHAIRYATYAGLLAFLLGGWRYRLGVYRRPYELRFVANRLFKYRRPEAEGF